ncbi:MULTISPECIES: molybdopterin oxidoreductase family protein [unclassified Sphingobium]|uniref:molybdopterin oxidoreductase family protein n=1 Tax=unclassified Sphingobium TaxID=2611147 RepID=UPI0035A6849A
MAVVRSLCGQCSIGCGIRATTGEGRALSISGDHTHPANGGLLCPRVKRLEREATLDGRLLRPMVQGRNSSWDRAAAQVAQRLKGVLARDGPGSVALHVGGGLLTEDYYVANKLMKGFLGSAHIHAPGIGAGAAVQRAAFGEDVMPGAFEDIDRAEIILLADPRIVARHPVLMDRVAAAREAGATVVSLGSAGELYSELDSCLAVREGSAARLVGGVLFHAWEAGVANAAHMHDVDGVLPGLRAGHDLWSVARTCGVNPAELRAFFELWIGRDRAVTLYPDDDAALAGAVINLHVATGRIGRAGAAPFGVPASSNAMGAREVGCLSDQLAAHRGFSIEALSDVARFWGARAMADAPGLGGEALLDAMRDGAVKALWSIGDLDEKDEDWLATARNAVALSVRSTPWADETADGWSVLLPGPVWGEKDGTVTGADRLISRQRRLFDLPGEARAMWWGMTKVAQAMGWGDAFHYERAAEVYREHVRLTAYRNDGARLLNLKRHAPISNPAYDELTPWRWGDVPFDEGRFMTADGKARLVGVD